jgi:hypothetical protein
LKDTSEGAPKREKIPAFDIGYRHEDEHIGDIELMVDDCTFADETAEAHITS